MKHLVLALTAAVAMSTTAVAQNKVKNLYASSSSLKVEQLVNTEQTVQLNRYLFAGYNTICVPMSVEASVLNQAEVRIERLAGLQQEGNTLYLCFVDCTNEGIQAGLPYLIYSPKAQYLRMKNTDAQNFQTEAGVIRMSDTEGNQVSFSSSWESKQKDGLYGIPAQQNTAILQSILIRTEADKTFLPTRCGFTWEQQSATANDLKIKHLASIAELGTTGIKQLSSKDGVVDIYDLKGNSVMKQVKAADALKSLKRGVYVIGGEKVVVQ